MVDDEPLHAKDSARLEGVEKTLEKSNKTADLDVELADPSYICQLFERY